MLRSKCYAEINRNGVELKVLLISPYRANTTFSAARQDLMPSEALLIIYSVLREAGHTPIMKHFTTRSTEEMENPLDYSKEVVLDIIRKKT